MEKNNNHINTIISNETNSSMLLKKIIQNRNEDIKDEINLFEWDWDDASVIKKNFDTFNNIVSYNTFFPDPVITNRINESKILKTLNERSTPIELILIEIEQLVINIPEIEIIIDTITFWIIYSISYSVGLSILKQVEASGKDCGISSTDQIIESVFRSRRRNEKTDLKNIEKIKKIKILFENEIQKTAFEKPIYDFIDSLNSPIRYFVEIFINVIAQFNEKELTKKKSMKRTIGIIKGDINEIMRVIPFKDFEKNNKKNLYSNLFPIFNLLDKSLQTEEEFKKNGTYRNYYDYKIHKVKIILGITKVSKTNGQNLSPSK